MFGVVKFTRSLIRKFLEFRCEKVASETILCHCDAPQRPDRSLISQVPPFVDEAYETIIVLLEEQKGVGSVLSHCLQPSRKFQHVLAGLV